MFGSFYVGHPFFGISIYEIIDTVDYDPVTGLPTGYYAFFRQVYGDIFPGFIDSGYYNPDVIPGGEFGHSDIDDSGEYGVV